MNRVLQWVIWFAAMTVVMRWLAKSREVPASEQSLVLQYPRAILATGVVVGAMFLVMAVASFVAPSGGPGVAPSNGASRRPREPSPSPREAAANAARRLGMLI